MESISTATHKHNFSILVSMCALDKYEQNGQEFRPPARRSVPEEALLEPLVLSSQYEVILLSPIFINTWLSVEESWSHLLIVV